VKHYSVLGKIWLGDQLERIYGFVNELPYQE
jgi:hypothetical protein